jgi:hypothetical protein
LRYSGLWSSFGLALYFAQAPLKSGLLRQLAFVGFSLLAFSR